MIERLRHPSSEDGKEVLRKLVAPSLLLGLAGIIKPFSIGQSELFAELGEVPIETLEDLQKKARMIAVPSLLAALTLYATLSLTEFANRNIYGKYLSVSKVKPGRDYFAYKFFLDLEKEKYFGELHFKGKCRIRFSKKENAHTVRKEAFHDFFELACAVERGDPRLSDLNYFVALSSMVTPLLERFGFKVVHFRDQLGLPAIAQEDQAELKLKMRPVMACMIDKKTLVENKEKLAKAGRLNNGA